MWLNGIRLNGWMRIGIILSVLWMLGGTAYLWHEAEDDSLSSARALAHQRSNCIGDNAVLRLEDKPELPCPSQEEVNEAFTRGHAGLGYSVLTTGIALLVAWAVVGLTYLTVQWIMKGFRPDY